MSPEQLKALLAIIDMNLSIIGQNYAVLNILFPMLEEDDSSVSPTLN